MLTAECFYVHPRRAKALIGLSLSRRRCTGIKTTPGEAPGVGGYALARQNHASEPPERLS
jgi:hypothetical protein